MRLLKLPWRRRDERGAVAILATILLSGVLIPSSALVVDVGNLYVEREELQSGADAAAVALARTCNNGSCTQADLTALTNSAKTLANANATDGHTKISEVCGNWGSLPACSAAGSNLSACIGPAPSGNYVEVRVKTELADGSTLLPPTFAQTIVGNENYKGTTVGACARSAASDMCVSAANETYSHTFNGPGGTATITPLKQLCAGQQQTFTLVSYTAPAATFSVPQYMYDSQVKTIDSNTSGSVSFTVAVPACYSQVDFVFANKPVNPLLSAVYGDTKVGSAHPPGSTSSGGQGWWNGGSTDCDPRPSVTLTSKCDGTVKVKMSNASAANIDAAFTVTTAGSSQFLRVAKGKNTTVTVLASEASSITVDDNTFTTKTGHWTNPGGC